MKMHVETIVDVEPEKAWQLIADQFGETGQWTSLLDSSFVQGKVKKGTQRICKIGDKELAEKITHLDCSQLTISYEITKGRPPFVDEGRNTWRVFPHSENRSRVTMAPSIQLKWWAIFMSPLMALGMKHSMKKVLEEFKHCAETGEAHPRKQAMIDRG
jgi:hypothetical protein